MLPMENKSWKKMFVSHFHRNKMFVTTKFMLAVLPWELHYIFNAAYLLFVIQVMYHWLPFFMITDIGWVTKRWCHIRCTPNHQCWTSRQNYKNYRIQEAEIIIYKHNTTFSSTGKGPSTGWGIAYCCKYLIYCCICYSAAAATISFDLVCHCAT